MLTMTHGMRRLKPVIIFLLLGMMVTACSDTTPAKPSDTTPTNEWDNMKWDQSTWG